MPTVDKTALEAALSSEFTTTIGDFGHMALNQFNYSTSTWNGYIQAVLNGVDVFNDNSSSQGTVDVAADAILTAKSALVLLPGVTTPAAPTVSISGSTATGLDTTMEYSVDNGPFVTYDANTFNALNLYGHTLRVRVMAANGNLTGDIATLVFGPAPVTGGSSSGGAFYGGAGGYNGPINGLGTLNQPINLSSVVPSTVQVFGIGGPISPLIFTSNGQVLGANTFFFSSNLTVGSRGNDVLNLQNYLASLGLFDGPFTGFFGPITKASVIAYQKANGLPQTGFFGPLTRASINANASVAAQAATTNNSSNPNGSAANLISSLEAAGIIDANQASNSRRFYGL